MSNYHIGSWQDLPDAALRAALNEVKLDESQYIKLHYSEGLAFEPVDSTVPWRINVEIKFSEDRQQYRATLRRIKRFVCPKEHTNIDHWREDLYGNDIRIRCDCDCEICEEY